MQANHNLTNNAYGNIMEVKIGFKLMEVIYMKKFICGLLVGIILTMGVTTYAVPEIKSALFSPDIKLVVDGKQLDTQIVSVVKTGEVNMTNYVSARALAESLGATVEWDGAERAINVSTETAAVSSASAPTSSNVQLPAIVDAHGVKGVLISEVFHALKAKGYDLVNSVDPNYMHIVFDNKIIVKEIPSNARGGKIYIPEGFYEANILPLLQ